MPRIRLITIYTIVANLLLFHLLLDLPREVAFRIELYRHEWYGIGIFTLALLVILAHLVAFGASLVLYGVLRGLEIFKGGRRFLEAVRPFELAVFLAFFYINFIYFDIFVTQQIQSLPLGVAELARTKTVLLFLASGACVVFFYWYKARILNFLETRLPILRRVAAVSLLITLGLSTLRVVYKHGDVSYSSSSTAALQPYSDSQTGSQMPMPNIIALTYDGLSAEHMSLYGYSRKTTPFLDEFAKRCTVFDNIRTVSQGTTTALLTFLLGKGPKTWGPRLKAGLVHEQDNAENLLRVLETRGYSIRALKGGSRMPKRFRPHCPEIFPGLRFHKTPSQFKDLGWFSLGASSLINGLLDYELKFSICSWIGSLKYFYDSNLGRVQRGVWKFTGRPIPVDSPPVDSPAMLRQRMDKDLMLPFLERELRNTEEPVFLWIHSYVPHPVFDPPPPYFGRYLESLEDWEQLMAGHRNPGFDTREVSKKLRARYDEYILYMDAGIAEALKIVREAELLNPWILIITADHGASQSYFLDSSNKALVRKEADHIPLIICELGQADGRRVQAPGGTLDFAPTILELIGIKPPAWMEGKPLVRFMERRR
ncbi:MAG: sulfatase-like hydrolase/transferase [Candidatus Brocadiales bacterium]|nr:sulfatase-like hydrolase/transferase [Candidatus Bathyanammoxibius sp.]